MTHTCHDCPSPIPDKAKRSPDGPRYKALGNSMACNVMRWIGRRIDVVDKIQAVGTTCT